MQQNARQLMIHAKLPEEMRNSLTIADLNRAKKNTYSQKRALYPRQPRNIIEVHETVNSMEVNTKSKNESFVLVNDPANNIIINFNN